MRTPTQIVVVVILAVLSGTAGFLVAGRAPTDLPAVEGLMWPNPRTVGPFEAQDQDGHAFTPAQLGGRWTTLFFGFTHCPDVCPTTLALLARIRPALEAATGGAGLTVAFVSVDPGRDTTDLLGPYVRYFDPAFIGIGGPGAMVLAQQLGIPVAMGKPDAAGNYSVDHSAALFLVDPKGRLVGVIPAPHTPESVEARFSAIVNFIQENDS